MVTSEQRQWQPPPSQTASWCSPQGTSAPSAPCRPPGRGSFPHAPAGAPEGSSRSLLVAATASVVPSDSWAPVRVCSSVSSPDSPSSRKWTGAGPARSGASPPSPHRHSFFSTLPQAGVTACAPPPGPPRAASPWRPAPLRRFSASVARGRNAPVPSSAPRLKVKAAVLNYLISQVFAWGKKSHL